MPLLSLPPAALRRPGSAAGAPSGGAGASGAGAGGSAESVPGAELVGEPTPAPLGGRLQLAARGSEEEAAADSEPASSDEEAAVATAGQPEAGPATAALRSRSGLADLTNRGRVAAAVAAFGGAKPASEAGSPTWLAAGRRAAAPAMKPAAHLTPRT